MVASLYLLSCVLAAAQPAPGGDWTGEVRLGRAQELVYRGSYNETTAGVRVQFDRSFRVETRVFVLDLQTKNTDAAIMTILKPHDNRSAQQGNGEPTLHSVRLERVQIGSQGKLAADSGASLNIPVDSVPLLECGAFVEVPKGRLSVGQSWETAEENRPSRAWRITGVEMANGLSCLKIVGQQQSVDWDHPRADSTAWKRTDTVWLAPRTGYAQRVERIIDRREPGRKEPTLQSVLRYELESSLQYPGNHAEDRRQEVTQVLAFRDAAAPFLLNPAKSKESLNSLGNRIDDFLKKENATPYREAILQLKRRIEAAKKGELTIATPEAAAPTLATASIGQLAPDFLATEVTTTKTAQLRKWMGRPVLMVFYHPASPTCPDVLPFCEKLAATYPQGISVLYLPVSENTKQVLKQREEMKLTQPALNGMGLRISYNVEATPKMVLLDSSEIVRGQWTGWGPQTPKEVLEELMSWLPKK